MKLPTEIYYKDELKDDFSGTEINQKPLGDDFLYVHKNIFWRLGSWIIYYVIALPLLRIYTKLKFGVKIKNRKVLKKLRKTGVIIYANHTHWIDSFLITINVAPKRSHIIANPDATSIKGIKNIVQMLGAIPLPSTYQQSVAFTKAFELFLKKKRSVVIFPEAHIWPYYTKIRPFPATSFGYPVKYNVPVLAAVTTFRKPKKAGKPPKFTVTFSEPFYPDQTLDRKEASRMLHQQVYQHMVDHVSNSDSFEAIKYIKLPSDNDENK